uniref:BZIP transcription factor n=1 Tax=Mesocestoides corti TaxID=53468 RepID=A0A5K3FPP0_MESCO
MSLSNIDSIFDCTVLPATDFTVSFAAENEQSKNAAANADQQQHADFEHKENIPPPNLQAVRDLHPNKDQDLTMLKISARHDIMEQISAAVLDLVAVDAKYSALTDLCATKYEKAANSPRRDTPVTDVQKRSPLEVLYTFMIGELRDQLSSLRFFIRELDVKYFEAAKSAQEQIARLEIDNRRLAMEIERLRTLR